MYTNNFNVSFLLLYCCFVFISLCMTRTALGSKILRVNCGSSGNEVRDSDGHKWEPDGKYLVGNFSKARSYHQDSSIVSVIPYMDARIFHSEATYKFPIIPQVRYFVRLYFHPTEYYHLKISRSFFSVRVDGITLLHNFSALIASQSRGQAFVVKEYSLAPFDDDTLKITFKPSRGNGSFAFINGIELAPINGHLFGMGPELGLHMHMINTDVANLETMYRLNVGGQFVPPKRDTGALGRAWFNDDPFLQGTAMGISIKADGRVPISHGKIPQYIAPIDVYSTSRTMGENSAENLMFNLTWLFEVDANFTYMVRLHFCDFILSKPNQVTFNIFINNQSAQSDPHPADIIAWTGKPGMPIYKDYMVTIDDNEGDKYIQVDLHPSTKTHPEFYDAQLSGLEIFKINDDNENLAGRNPGPSGDLTGKITTIRFIISEREMVVGATAGVFFAAALYLVVSKKKKLDSVSDMKINSSRLEPIYGSSHVINTSSRRSNVTGSSKHSKAQSLCRRFTLAEMKLATKNFKESNVIGVGGFGNVYKGYIDENEKVAIKRSNPQSEQGIDEFDTEIEMLSHLRHKHLVSLIGFCEEEYEKILVYDYMSKGTLSNFLHNPKGKTKLSWIERLEICIGAARGLHYLHTGATHTIIHRDVKTTNILLDENLVAKVSDFGLSKISCPTKGKGHAISTVVKGSFGYLDPEYFRKRRLTEKSDVYAFGVVLFEVLCRRPAVDTSLPVQQMNLAEWALRCNRNGTLEGIIDPEIKDTINPECLKKYMETALKCLSEEGSQRPAMSDVLWNLEYVLQLQEVPDSAEITVTRTISGHGNQDQELII